MATKACKLQRSRDFITDSRRSRLKCRNTKMRFLHVQRVFIVKKYLASHCKKEFRDAFHDYPVPKQSTISRLLNRLLKQ